MPGERGSDESGSVFDPRVETCSSSHLLRISCFFWGTFVLLVSLVLFEIVIEGGNNKDEN